MNPEDEQCHLYILTKVDLRKFDSAEQAMKQLAVEVNASVVDATLHATKYYTERNT